MKLLREALDMYFTNALFFILFSLPILLTIPLIEEKSYFFSFSFLFLRFSSLTGEISLISTLLLYIAVILSLFIYSFVIASFALLVKTRKTRVFKREWVENIGAFTLRIFTILFFAYTLYLLLGIYSFKYLLGPNIALVFPVFSFLWWTLFFFAPQSVVIDEVSALPAFFAGLRFLRRNFRVFFEIILISALLVVAISLPFSALATLMPIAPFFALALNFFFVQPLVEIMKTLAYMRKYKLAP